MNGCKACLRVIENDNPIFYLSDIYMDPANPFSDAVSIKDKLADCVPELLLDTSNAVICKPCVASLTAAYNFRQRCLEVQHKIQDYLQRMPVNTEINVGQIAMYYTKQEMVVQEEKPLISAVDKSNNSFATSTSTASPVPLTLCDNMTEISIKQEPPETTTSVKKTTPKSSFKCKICNHESQTEYSLKRHKRIHNEEYRVGCPNCQFRCKALHDLKAHMKSKHQHSDAHGSHDFENETKPVRQKNVAQKKTKESRCAKRKHIKEQKQLVAQMPPILVINPH